MYTITASSNKYLYGCFVLNHSKELPGLRVLQLWGLIVQLGHEVVQVDSWPKPSIKVLNLTTWGQSKCCLTCPTGKISLGYTDTTAFDYSPIFPRLISGVVERFAYHTLFSNLITWGQMYVGPLCVDSHQELSFFRAPVNFVEIRQLFLWILILIITLKMFRW